MIITISHMLVLIMFMETQEETPMTALQSLIFNIDILTKMSDLHANWETHQVNVCNQRFP